MPSCALYVPLQRCGHSGAPFVALTAVASVLVDEAIIKAGGWTRELMLRHEIGNGWPRDHPGQRPHDGDQVRMLK